jgi:hypothetical protein
VEADAIPARDRDPGRIGLRRGRRREGRAIALADDGKAVSARWSPHNQLPAASLREVAPRGDHAAPGGYRVPGSRGDLLLQRGGVLAATGYTSLVCPIVVAPLAEAGIASATSPTASATQLGLACIVRPLLVPPRCSHGGRPRSRTLAISSA